MAYAGPGRRRWGFGLVYSSAGAAGAEVWAGGGRGAPTLVTASRAGARAGSRALLSEEEDEGFLPSDPPADVDGNESGVPVSAF